MYIFHCKTKGILKHDLHSINQSINQSKVICRAPKSKVCSKALRQSWPVSKPAGTGELE